MRKGAQRAAAQEPETNNGWLQKSDHEIRMLFFQKTTHFPTLHQLSYSSGLR